MYWTGAIIFLSIVVAPLLDRVRPPSFQRALARQLWRMAHLSMWIALGVLVASGVLLLYDQGQLNTGMLSASFIRSPMGMKLGLVGTAILLSFIHDFMAGPGARRTDARAIRDEPAFGVRALPWVIALSAIGISLLSIMMRQ
jgi:hypothetical protein